jgi:TolA-binding protein
MRVVEIYEAGGFPKLVLESKKEFAASYGLQAEYWRHFDVNESPEVLSYLKTNLRDLANHHHALYQEEELADDAPENFREALRWYRAYLASFPDDLETPGIHHRMADLLLEHQDFADAAREYERTAYDYPEHQRAAAAGYAAIYAHREEQKRAAGAEREAARREAVTSTLRFVDRFPEHEHAGAVLGAAVDDLYEMKEFERAIATARRLIDEHPEADPSIRRSAWAVVAHASFDLADYPQAEQAYARVLEMTPAEDDSHQEVVDNLAAAIYKQGEQANLAEDHRSAAAHFLRIAKTAPSSEIRPLAEYDAGAALIRLEDWDGATEVLESFRQSHPDHELHSQATRQLALVHREKGNLARAAEEYERVAVEAEDRELRGEALLVAGELYEDSGRPDRALAAYLSYVGDFSEPLETAVETRFKIAEMYRAAQDEASHHDQLQRIVEIDATAGDARTARVRYLAAQSALVLSEGLYHHFDEVELVQPFESSLQEKERRMDAALEAFARLVDYEIGDVTAAATFYMAERIGTAGRPRPCGASGLRDGPGRGGLPLRRAGHRGPREESRADGSRRLQPLDREESRKAREADARALREVRSQHRLHRLDRSLRLSRTERRRRCRHPERDRRGRSSLRRGKRSGEGGGGERCERPVEPRLPCGHGRAPRSWWRPASPLPAARPAPPVPSRS